MAKEWILNSVMNRFQLNFNCLVVSTWAYWCCYGWRK